LICGVPNGYQVPIYAYATRCGHADCIDKSHRLAMEGAIDALIDLALKHAVQRMKHGSVSPGVAAEGAKTPEPPPSKEVSAWTRYMRPEFDFEVVIPAVVSRRSNRAR
jgi:hypothetical protein